LERETCAKRARKHAIFDRLEKNMSCDFSRMRKFLIAVLSIRIAHRAPPRVVFAGIRRGGSKTRPLCAVIRVKTPGTLAAVTLRPETPSPSARPRAQPAKPLARAPVPM